MTDSWHVSAPVCGDATWTKLAELAAADDLLLHDSQTPGLSELTPRAPLDFSHDEFSKRTAIVVTEDPTWAIACAIRSAGCRQFLNACFYPLDSSGEAQQRRIFLSYAQNDDGGAPLCHGVVYVIARSHFLRMPPHTDPVLGPITECRWASTEAVPVVAEIPVSHQNLPMTPRFHDLAAVAARARGNPDGFPWPRQTALLQISGAYAHGPSLLLIYTFLRPGPGASRPSPILDSPRKHKDQNSGQGLDHGIT